MAARKRALSIADIRASFQPVLPGLHPDLQKNFEYLCLMAEQGQRGLAGFTKFKDIVVTALAQAQEGEVEQSTEGQLKTYGSREDSEQERQAIFDFISTNGGCSFDMIKESVDPKRKRPAHCIRYQLRQLREQGLIRTKGTASATRYFKKGR